jgi:hypothetical protein
MSEIGPIWRLGHRLPSLGGAHRKLADQLEQRLSEENHAIWTSAGGDTFRVATRLAAEVGYIRSLMGLKTPRDAYRASNNVVYAFRIDGQFSRIRTRRTKSPTRKEAVVTITDLSECADRDAPVQPASDRTAKSGMRVSSPNFCSEPGSTRPNPRPCSACSCVRQTPLQRAGRRAPPARRSPRPTIPPRANQAHHRDAPIWLHRQWGP